jgi:hypothetical protein
MCAAIANAPPVTKSEVAFAHRERDRRMVHDCRHDDERVEHLRARTG